MDDIMLVLSDSYIHKMLNNFLNKIEESHTAKHETEQDHGCTKLKNKASQLSHYFVFSFPCLVNQI